VGETHGKGENVTNPERVEYKRIFDPVRVVKILSSESVGFTHG